MERVKVRTMEQLEKVEKLRQRANVSYEEAKMALEQSNWDLLDAMVYLEQMGKVDAPNNSSYSTSYEEQTQYVSVPDTIYYQNTSGEEFFSKMKRIMKKLWKKSKENFFCIHHKGEEVIKMRLWGLALTLLLAWHFAIPAMVISLFFGCHYSFCGKADLSGMNDVMNKAGAFAEKVKDEYNKL